MERSQVINFNSGPCALPTAALEEAAKGLLNYQGTGIGITELSHRSPEFGALVAKLESLIRGQLDVPSTHSILFTQGGATGQFSAVVLNLLARHRLLHPELPDEDRVMDFVVTGTWSKKAAEEAERLGGGRVNIVADAAQFSSDGASFDRIPPHDKWAFSPKPAFVYYCENETIDGVQFSADPSSPSAFPHHLIDEAAFTPIVGDYSSSFMSRPINNLAGHALIYAGAQKNLGPAGLTVLIVRKDLLVDTNAAAKLGATPVPITLDYKVLASAKSLYNTPPMFSMYVASLVLEQYQAGGGLASLKGMNERKQKNLYDVLDEGAQAGLFKVRVAKDCRSWMNATFHILGEGNEEKFLEDAEKGGLKQLAGHRSIGGVRVSLYNAITEQQTDVLVSYIREFIQKTSGKAQGS